MNKRKAKKKHKYEIECEEIWGYVMPYAELRKERRSYHENVVVSKYCRNSNDTAEYEELAYILGIPFENTKQRYIYPNRLRIGQIRKLEGNGFHKVL